MLRVNVSSTRLDIQDAGVSGIGKFVLRSGSSALPEEIGRGCTVSYWNVSYWATSFAALKKSIGIACCSFQVMAMGFSPL